MREMGEAFEQEWKKAAEAIGLEDLPEKTANRFKSWLAEASKGSDPARKWRRAALICSAVLLALAALPASGKRATIEDQIHRLRIQAEIMRARANQQVKKKKDEWNEVRDKVMERGQELKNLAIETGEGMKTDVMSFRKRLAEAYHHLGELLSKH